MYLYIDETETDNYFIVVGLLMPSQEITDQTFRIFKNSIKNYYIPHKQKAKLFNEFKSTLTKNKYRYIRRRMVEALIIDCSQIFCCKKAKRTQTIKQGEKEKYYLRLIDCMMRLLRNDELHVRFDSFGINRFDSIVISKISNYKTLFL